MFNKICRFIAPILMALMIICLIFILSGCEAKTSQISVNNTNEWDVPSELSDCAFFEMQSKSSEHLYVMRCPMSSTSVTRLGKHPIHTITIDGKIYEEVAQ
jgi:hypothetical protein